ncbi:2-amino-4-hydroxy-6-hydroxymethyldihydropteridine diphosphokinase [Lihuaxuella thermophila]|uniref:2-amino-4-hydroxy-6- hydroxymethyldihydropteridine diphosphokinase n=1 Tax=Lihuaxuella thermophila TaxID=1173111 RepID=UPI000B7FC043|nr:2-amino-4-hydroxy-6-hydroxymethyldihydropteridine diphosphokinase [Lihuaxuella thermophila]
MVTAYLGLGANLGDRQSQLRQAIERLNQTPGIRVTRLSSVYETAPVGYLDQPNFYNLVAEVKTTLTPNALLSVILQIEQKLHRVREVRWGPRTIDIDILLYGDRAIEQDELQIPHPRMKERAFVLVPLSELAGNKIIPGTDQTVEQWAGALTPDQQIRRLDLLLYPEGLSLELNR